MNVHLHCVEKTHTHATIGALCVYVHRGLRLSSVCFQKYSVCLKYTQQQMRRVKYEEKHKPGEETDMKKEKDSSENGPERKHNIHPSSSSSDTAKDHCRGQRSDTSETFRETFGDKIQNLNCSQCDQCEENGDVHVDV